MAKFKIDHRLVGDNIDPLVIAEIGINHNGNLDVAIELVDSAIKAGVEVIKHQTHIPDEEMSSEAKKIKPGNSRDNIYKIIKRCTLSEKNEKKLFDYVKKKKKIIISSPFSKAAAIRLAKFKIPAFKVGSGESNNHHFIKFLCTFKKPIILSTGMNSILSIKKSIQILRKNKIKYALLHCTNLYPTPNKFVRLNCVEELKKAYPDAVVGLSDHTLSNNACLGSVALGASILERHYIDNRLTRTGPDIKCSMNENELKELIKGSKEIFDSLGGGKRPLKEEKITINFAFQSVVSTRNINRGEKFTLKNITLKRPGTGYFKTQDFGKIIGKKVKKNIFANTQIRKEHV